MSLEMADRAPGAGEERARLEEKLARLPSQPGVYLMKNAAGEVIYVGKAVSLRSRRPLLLPALPARAGAGERQSGGDGGRNRRLRVHRHRHGS